MMKAAITDTEDLPMFEPKMTRSKLKEVVEKGVVIPTWNLSPIKKTSEVKAPQFVDIPLEEEDSSDEEYCPEEEEEDETAEESLLESDVESTASSPRGHKRPRMEQISEAAETGEAAKEVDRRAPGFVRHISAEVVPMGPPPPPKLKPTQDSTFMEKLHAVDEELASSPVCMDSFQSLDESLIAFRTRSKRPLKDVPIGQLEAKLQAPDITPDMYDPNTADDEDWKMWLQSLMQDDVEIEDEADDDDDPEYNILEDLDEPDTEDLRNDRAVRITKKEVNELMEELFETFQDEMGFSHMEDERPEDEDSNPGAPHNFNTPQAIRFEEPLVNLLNEQHRTVRAQLEFMRMRKSIIKPPLQLSEETKQDQHKSPPKVAPILYLDGAQKMRLQQQMQQHVQLLTQVHLLTCRNPRLGLEADTARMFLVELSSFAESSALTHRPHNPDFQSMFQPCNLREALQLLPIFHSNVPEDEVSPKSKKQNVSDVTCLPKHVAWIVATRPLFMYPELLPVCALKARGPRDRVFFTKAEDSLLALGLKHFDGVEYAKPLISKYLVIAKTAQQLTVHIKNLTMKRAPDNIIKFYKKTKLLPVMLKCCEDVLPQDARPPVEREKHRLPIWLKVSLSSIEAEMEKFVKHEQDSCTKSRSIPYPLLIPPGLKLNLKPFPSRFYRRSWRQKRSSILKPLLIRPSSNSSGISLPKCAAKTSVPQPCPIRLMGRVPHTIHRAVPIGGVVGEHPGNTSAPGKIQELCILMSSDGKGPQVFAASQPAAVTHVPVIQSKVMFPKMASQRTLQPMLSGGLGRKDMPKTLGFKASSHIPSAPLIFAVPNGALKLLNLGSSCGVLQPVSTGSGIPLTALLLNPTPIPVCQTLTSSPLSEKLVTDPPSLPQNLTKMTQVVEHDLKSEEDTCLTEGAGSPESEWDCFSITIKVENEGSPDRQGETWLKSEKSSVEEDCATVVQDTVLEEKEECCEGAVLPKSEEVNSSLFPAEVCLLEDKPNITEHEPVPILHHHVSHQQNESEQPTSQQQVPNHSADQPHSLDHPMGYQQSPKHPATDQPGPEHPVGNQHYPEYPVSQQLGLEHSASNQQDPEYPMGEQHSPVHPAINQQGQDHIIGQHHILEHHSTCQQGPEHPAGHQQSPEHPAGHQQSPEHPAGHQQSPEHPAGHQQSPEHPAGHQQSPEHPAGHQQSPEHPAGHQQSPEHPAGHQQSPEHQAVHQQYPEHPAVHQQYPEHPAVHQQGPEHPAVHQQSPEHPAVHQQGPEHPAVHQQGPEHPAVHQQGPEHPAVHQQGPEHPAVHQQGPEHPAVHQQGPEHPAVHQQAPGDTEDHREAPGDTEDHREAQRDTEDHREAPGDIEDHREGSGNTDDRHLRSCCQQQGPEEPDMQHGPKYPTCKEEYLEEYVGMKQVGLGGPGASGGGSRCEQYTPDDNTEIGEAQNQESADIEQSPKNTTSSTDGEVDLSSPAGPRQNSSSPSGRQESCTEKDGAEEEEEEDFDDLTQDEDEEEMSSASEESVLSVPELQETMEKLTWLASERRLSQEGDSEENSQEENSEQEEEEEEEEGEGVERSSQKEKEMTDAVAEESKEKAPSHLRVPSPAPVEIITVTAGDKRRGGNKGQSSHRVRSRRGRARTSKDTSKLLLLYDENILNKDPLREQKDMAFAQSYLNRVREALQCVPGKYEHFLNLIYQFEESRQKRTAVDLYESLRDLLREWPQLLKDFAAFLLPEQALECGLFEEQQAFDKSRKFLRQLEICFNENPAQHQKIIKVLQSCAECPLQEMSKLKAQMWQLLRGHNHLQEEFSLFFDQLRPPASRLGEFEVVNWTEDKEYMFDGFEEVMLPHVEEDDDQSKLAAPQRNKRKKEMNQGQEKDIDCQEVGKDCPCSCHEVGNEQRVKKCKRKMCAHCSTKVCENRSHRTREGPEVASGGTCGSVRQGQNIKEAGVSEGRLTLSKGTVAEHRLTTGTRGPAGSRGTSDANISTHRPRSTTSRGATVTDNTSTSKQRLPTKDLAPRPSSAHRGGRKSITVKRQDMVTEKVTLSHNYSTPTAPLCPVVPTPGECTDILPLFNSTNHTTTTCSSPKSTDCVSDHDPVILSTDMKDLSDPSPTDGSHREEQTPTVCAKNITVSSSGEKVILWTREADRVILTMCQERGAREETFTAVSLQLGNKSPEEVSQRFRELVSLFQTACVTSSDEEEEGGSATEQLSDQEAPQSDED
ncbi:GON-4-like protein [Rhinophrynus dorsalis]